MLKAKEKKTNCLLKWLGLLRFSRLGKSKLNPNFVCLIALVTKILGKKKLNVSVEKKLFFCNI